MVANESTRHPPPARSVHASPSVFACPVCTIISFDRALCAECAEGLWARRAPVTRELGAYQTRGLFSWVRDGWPALRWWAMALKKKEHEIFWREPATWCLDTFGRPADGTTFVPVPGTAKQNHALGFARALNTWSGLAVADVLAPRAQDSKQRRLGVFARRGRRFDLSGEPPRGTIVLIDDVITSGATVEAAYRALGQPLDFSAWCLMDRRPPGTRG